MNLLIENGLIEEITCGTNFAYVLNDNAMFLSTEYKVLQSQTNSSFVRCMKMLYNGRIEFLYLVNSYKPLSALLPHLDPDHFITIVGNLLSGIIEVKNNGFLSCNNIDSSFEHIYVDQNTLKVGLVYLPINRHEYSDNSLFENAVRTNLVRIISGLSSISSPKTIQLGADLQNGILSIEDVFSRIGGNESTVLIRKKESTPSDCTHNGVLKLVALNAPTKVEIKVTKTDFTIGKKDTNDGVISFNKMISRNHCMISRNGNQFTISDLQSANGTYVNGIRLQPHIPKQLKSGDMVRLANSDFQVVIG